ncbi:hypothetical protein BaRGS_00002390, partial [Batillaria attramentaria]
RQNPVHIIHNLPLLSQNTYNSADRQYQPALGRQSRLTCCAHVQYMGWPCLTNLTEVEFTTRVWRGGLKK